MPKRTFEHVEPSSPTLPPTSSSSPAKRIHTSSTPASRSTATYGSSTLSTPYTPSVYSIPADSPTNPLGLKRRVNNLTLPKATPFSKHVALRFQLITAADPAPPSKRPSLWDASPGSSSPSADALNAAVFSKNPLATQYASEGTYRVVQAPLSYTFRHLCALIPFLFSRNHLAAAQRPCVPGHLFAVHHGISIGGPGEIARGKVRVKLSRARDPYYSSRSLADLIAAADAQGQDEEDLEDEEEDASWRWEGEDDFTLGHVWEARFRNPKRGIIYYHDDTTAVHITLNTQTVPHRKGVGNMPFVFRAYGNSHLNPPPHPRSPLSSPTELPTSAPPPPRPRIFPTYKRPTTTTAAAATRKAATVAPGSPTPLDREGDTEVDDSFSSDEDVDFDGGLDTRLWNHSGAFPRFLSALRSNAPSSSSSSCSSASPSPSTPPSPSSSPSARKRAVRRATTMPHAYAAASASGNTSSAASLSLPSSVPYALDSTSQSSPQLLSSSPTRSLPSLTPAPVRVRTRYRVARAARRLLGLAERGLESAAAEEADVVDGRVQGLSKKGRVSSKGDGRKDKARSQRDVAKSKSRPKTKTMTGDDAEEVWNPFAHLKKKNGL